MTNRFANRVILAAAMVGSLLLWSPATMRADDRCEKRVHKAEENLHQAERRHGEHSRQAEERRRQLEDVRAKCGRDRR
ncbi:MAG TPA: hypothetical protein VKV95_19830 [Terriglobia bacterium]|nr:hypothetical protein [Terriglobia bacterium]